MTILQPITIALAAAVVLSPASGSAQGAPSASKAPAPAAATPALTRGEVSAEVQRAMRDGTWRCATNNRGWCGITRADQGSARNPRPR